MSAGHGEQGRRPGLARAPRWLRPLRAPRGSWLTREAEERFFEAAEVLLEGGVRRGEEGEERWVGSAMLTVPLERWLGPVPAVRRGDREVAAWVAALDGSVRVHLKAMRLACAQVAHRVPKRSLGRAQVAIRARHDAGRILLDVDLEVPLEVRRAAGSGGDR